MPDGRIVQARGCYPRSLSYRGTRLIVAPLSWPVIGWIADRTYGVFVRNRVLPGRSSGRSCDGP